MVHAMRWGIRPIRRLAQQQGCETVLDQGLLWLEPEEWTAWRLRVKAEHMGGNLTPARRDALCSLVALMSAGDDTPTDEAVAKLAGCSPRTVRRARADARELGLLNWEQTRRLVCGAWRQGPNRYALRVPASPVCPAGQDGRARKSERKIEAREAPRSVSAMLAAYGIGSLDEARAGLAAINARRAAQLGLAPLLT